MEMKTEALALADYLDNNVEAMLFTEQPHLDKASAMIRRLVEEVDKLKDMLAKHQDIIADWDKKPLSDEEICELWLENSYGLGLCNIAFEYARAIEERHGIK